MLKFSYLKSTNADYIDQLHARYLSDPDSIDPTWRYFFEGLELGTELPTGEPLENGHDNGSIRGLPAAPALQTGTVPQTATATVTATAAVPVPSPAPSPLPSNFKLDLNAEAKVAELITAYRDLGRLLADINPLCPPPASHPYLDLEHFGLTAADLTKTFTAGKLIGLGTTKLSDIIAWLRETYCRSIAVEISHIQDPNARQWLQRRLESTGSRDEALTDETRKHIFKRLAQAETFERFLHTRYVAQKRFSVEGGEAVIPSLDCMIETGAELGASEFVLGMAHRGRLNVLHHIFGKPAAQIFTEFEGTYKIDASHGEGDVKYHKGYSADFTTRLDKKVHLSLGSNPSHLEFINPVIEGIARAKQTLLGDQERSRVMPILIHGDAAFAGQGVCYETLNLSQLAGYKTGGTLHVVINNQVGFTADPEDTRSTTYCTDLAKMLDAPVLHVNGDDAEAVWYVSKICTEYRQKFKSDVFIDIICYRKHGHNEADEPAFTQPILYKKIKAHPSPREVYEESLKKSGALPAPEAQAIIDRITADFTAAQQAARAEPQQPHVSVFGGSWQGLRQAEHADLLKPVPTAVDENTLRKLAEQMNVIPAGFHLHPKLQRFFDGRIKAIREGKGIDWGTGEALAFASLLNEGHPVRLSGQDAERGTFSHRQSVLHDTDTGEHHVPLNEVARGPARYEVFNSHLSETGVLGFEYGYALADPNTLTIWEAQFGDFANGAQVIIDQFITTSESKWQRMSGLVMLLPHGYEGQGPEHSSARLERFLQLSGRDNISVVNITTPANLFHGLRRQLKRDFRKPLVVMSPKSLLRHPLAISELSDFTTGAFQEVLDDPAMASWNEAKKVRRTLLCSGKVYYDLVAERATLKRDDVAIVRLEQLYPFPAGRLAEVVNRYKNSEETIWVQEEPRNMGAWTYLFALWNGGLGSSFAESVESRKIRYVGRDVGAAPAVGSAKVHEVEQRALLGKALGE